MRARRPIKRSRALGLRMALVAVVTPVTALALLVALVVAFSGWHRWMLVMAACVGLCSTVSRMRRTPPDDWVLQEGDDPELLAVVDRLCVLIDIERPDIVLSDQKQPNSWVVHLPRRRPRLYVTKGLRELLSLDELQAVIAHELTHIANRDALVISVVGLPSALMLRGGHGWPYAIFAVAGGLTQTGTLLLSRYRELAADAGAAAITGRPSALASALLKVSDSLRRIPTDDLRAAAALNVFNLVAVDDGRRWWHGIPGLARIAASHPSLQDRLDALHELERAQHERHA